MEHTIDSLAAHLRQLDAVTAADAVARTPAAQTAEEHMGLTILPGTRVLDLVTGEEGVAIGGTVKHTIVPVSEG